MVKIMNFFLYNFNDAIRYDKMSKTVSSECLAKKRKNVFGFSYIVKYNVISSITEPIFLQLYHFAVKIHSNCLLWVIVQHIIKKKIEELKEYKTKGIKTRPFLRT